MNESTWSRHLVQRLPFHFVFSIFILTSPLSLSSLHFHRIIFITYTILLQYRYIPPLSMISQLYQIFLFSYYFSIVKYGYDATCNIDELLTIIYASYNLWYTPTVCLSFSVCLSVCLPDWPLFVINYPFVATLSVYIKLFLCLFTLFNFLFIILNI